MANNNTISILIQAKDEASPIFRSTVDSMQSVGDSAIKVGKGLTSSLTLPLAGVGVASLKMAGDFEQSLNVLQSVTGATTDQMSSLRKEARDLGNDVSLPGISAKDAAAAMTELAKAGLNVNDVMSASKGVLSLAKAGQMDVGDAAMTTARALNGFGLEGKEANRIADLLAASANASTASVSDMALGLQMVGAQSHSMGVSLQDTVTALAMFSNAGINGSDAGTSLKQMFLQLATPTKQSSEMMQKLGLDFFDAKGNFIGLGATAQQLQEKLKNLTVEQRNNALGIIFGSDATRVATILAQGGSKAFDQMSTSVNKQGAATDLAAAQNKGFNGALDNLKSTAETAMIDIGTTLLPMVTRELKKLTDEVGKVSAWFNSLSTGQQDFIFKTGGMIAILGPALLITGTFAKSISSITKVTMAASKALGLFKTAGLVSEAGAGVAALGKGVGLAGAAEGATTAIAGSGGLLAALGPIGLALGATAVVAGGAYLAYRHFKDAANDTSLAMKGVFTPVTLLALAQEDLKRKTDNVKKSSEDYSLTVDHLSQLQKNAVTLHQDVKKATDDVNTAQLNVNSTLNQFGQNSPQYHQAVQILHDKTDALNQKLADEGVNNLNISATSADVATKLGIQAGAVDLASKAQQSLNDLMGGTVDIIKNFGPAAILQVKPITDLQSVIGNVITSWSNVNINIQSQLTALNDRLHASGDNITALQKQSGGLAVQSSSGGLQGAATKLQGHALGTNYAPGGPTLVGEHGAEMINMPAGAQVIPAAETRNSGMSQVINNVLSGNFTFQNADASNAFWDRLDKTQRLAQIGMA